MSIFDFDATQVEPAEEYKALPAGEYRAVVTKIDLRENKAKTGKYLNIMLTVLGQETDQGLDPRYARRIVFTKLNVVNSNPQAQNIAQRQLSSLMHSIGEEKTKLNGNNFEVLYDRPLTIDVKFIGAHDGYPDQNDVKKFTAADVPSLPAVKKSEDPKTGWR